MSQDFLSMEEVDLLLKGVTGEDDAVDIDPEAWVEAMSEVEAHRIERKVRYTTDGNKLTREELKKYFVFKQEEARRKADVAHAVEFAYMNALEMIGAME